MIRYLLDANAVVDLLRDPSGGVSRRVRVQQPSEIGLSAVALHELYCGAFRSARQEHNLALVDRLLFEVVDLDSEDARRSGEVRATLARLGTPIGPSDVLIAGQALARGLILVSANVADLRRVDGLAVEDWRGTPG